MAGGSNWDGKIKTAVVTGEHSFAVQDLHGLFRSMPEIDFYPQHMAELVTDVAGARHFGGETNLAHPWLNYDVLLFYNMHRSPPDPKDKLGVRTIEVFERLGEAPTGIVMMHHSVLAFPDWPLWSEMVGIRERSFDADPEHTLSVEVLDLDHPITRGMPSWEMIDETYIMDGPGEGSTILATTDHPNSMKALLWTRMYRNSRVVCTSLGHGRRAYSTPQYRDILVRGIQWAAGRL